MILNAKTCCGEVAGLPGFAEGVAVYKGIPYAAPPVGDLRWAPPQPHPGWEGVRRCETFGPAAIQRPASGDGFYGREFYSMLTPERYSEDCLYLNVWTPAKSADERLPVMMWMHGGGNMGGYSYESEFDGEALASRGVVYVSVGFRLNVFGFLAHPELTAEQGGHSGNYCHLDHLAALRWIKDNIAEFGGDPGNVTVFGQSGGGFDVNILATSPLAAGLVHRGISQSAGGAMSLMEAVPLTQMEQNGLQLQEILGCRSIAELRQVPTEEIYAASMKVRGNGMFTFTTAIDGYLLDDDSSRLMQQGKINPFSYMMGCCSNEGGRGLGDHFPIEKNPETFESQVRRSCRLRTEDFLAEYHVKTNAEAERFWYQVGADGAIYGYQL